MGRRQLAFGALLLASCNWIVGIHELPSDARGDVLGTTDALDAPTDAQSLSCSTGATRCSGRDLQTCVGEAWQSQTCDFTCAAEPAATCVAASNMTSVTATCGSAEPSTWPVLDPGAGGTITYATTSGGSTSLACATGSGSDCGTIAATIIDTSNPPGVAWFCVQSLVIEVGATLVADSAAEPTTALGLVVDGDARIDGTIALDGSDAIVNDPQPGRQFAGGPGGPGGFTGGSGNYTANVGPSGSGLGESGGKGGQGSDAGGPNHAVSAGGGGGGNSSIGGNGGAATGGITELGGAGGSLAVVDWLVGGAGGGSTTSGVRVGIAYPGAGGGGAIQISARGQITFEGELSARGGAGFSTPDGTSGMNQIAGGTGGGAGGMILLEAPLVTATGMLIVDGGAGGSGDPDAPGGTGASGSAQAQAGASASSDEFCGGAGGGGGAGRIVVHSTLASCPIGGISPSYSCTAAALQGSAE